MTNAIDTHKYGTLHIWYKHEHCCFDFALLPVYSEPLCSPELKTQASFSDRLLSVVCLLTFNIFIFFSRTTGPISTKFGTKQPWEMGIQVCSTEWPRPFPRGENTLSNFKTLLLQNQRANFNQSWHKASLGLQIRIIFNSQKGYHEFYLWYYHSSSQMCLLPNLVSQVSDVSHELLVRRCSPPTPSPPWRCWTLTWSTWCWPLTPTTTTCSTRSHEFTNAKVKPIWQTKPQEMPLGKGSSKGFRLLNYFEIAYFLLGFLCCLYTSKGFTCTHLRCKVECIKYYNYLLTAYA